ncbi:MAG: citrate transporter, partial [Oscillospiraceae bacterium]|nr:citrate transporter [Oscillospiraceae bacterium]
KRQRLIYLCLFVMIMLTVLTRTPYYLGIAAVVLCAVLVFDRQILIKTDYVLILTFFCFFVFSSSIAANSQISSFLTSSVRGREYVWGILLSQLISNVPAAIVLYPFTGNLAALLYGVDTAGLCSLIGSLASVINYRIYVREYPENGKKFIKTFTLISLAFFAIVAVPGFLISKYWTF